MFQNYLKVTLRHLLKRKSYALINTLGLAIGMAGCLLLAQYVTFEVSYDGFHEQADRIYRLSYSKQKSGVRSFDSALTYAGVGSLMKNTFPEVQDVARLLPSRGLISTGSSVFEEQDLYFADPSYLTMFSLPLLRGDHALRHKQVGDLFRWRSRGFLRGRIAGGASLSNSVICPSIPYATTAT